MKGENITKKKSEICNEGLDVPWKENYIQLDPMKHKHAYKVSFQEAYNHYAQVSKQKKILIVQISYKL